MAAPLYTTAAKILEKVLKKQGTAKSLVTTSCFPNKKKLLALVCATLKYRSVIEEILVLTDLLKLEKQLKHTIALVLLYDFLFGHGIHCGGKMRQCIMRHKSSLSSALARLKVKAKVASNEDLIPKEQREKVSLPRYVRVNTLKATVENVIKSFQEDGFKLLDSRSAVSLKQLTKDPLVFMCDTHLPDVLVFSPGTDLHDNSLYLSGKIILQEKASCFPAHVLSPPVGAHVIDACSAPGNKTSHLACLMQNSGKIFSFDIDRGRMETLKKQMKKVGASCVTARNMDFLKVNPMDPEYRRVKYILVDPSCSGSGIVNRMDHFIDDKSSVHEGDTRLESLAGFQLAAVKHAMSFPSVKRVVYSTCSVYKQENEEVVEKALRDGKFQLGCSLPIWPRRGFKIFAEAERCVRALPEDYTNGFFVALFERKEDKTSNKTKQMSQPENVSVNNTTTVEVNRSCTNKKRKQETLLGHKRTARKKRKFEESISSCNNTKEPQTKKPETNFIFVNKNSANSVRDKALLHSKENSEQSCTSCRDAIVIDSHARESTVFYKKNTKKKRKRKRKIPVTS